MMKQLHKIILILALIFIPLATNAAGWNKSAADSDVVAPSNNAIDINILVNSTQQFVLEGAPTKGYLEVYSIIGVKVKTINLQSAKDGYSVDLAKGLYILRAGKVARKIVVR